MQEIDMTYYDKKKDKQESKTFKLKSPETLRELEEKFKNFEISRYPEVDEYINLKIVQRVDKYSPINIAQPVYYKNYDKKIVEDIFEFLEKN